MLIDLATDIKRRCLTDGSTTPSACARLIMVGHKEVNMLPDITKRHSRRLWVVSTTVLLILVCSVVYYVSRPLDMNVIALTKNTAPGRTATIVVQGEPHTTYSISVHYRSGPSKAAGLYPKTSDASGRVSWSWTVGTRTTKGQWPIIIRKGSRTFSTSFNVR